MKLFKAALTVALATLICVLPLSPLTAMGETYRYAYAGLDAEAYFCKDKDLTTALFAIPETYCVEILKEDGDWYFCRYAKDEGVYTAVRGYCLKSDLTPVAEPLENEYLNYPISVDFFAKQGSLQIEQFKVTLTVAFYGNGTMNASGLSYVAYGELFGYVSETVKNYPKNDIPQPTVSTDVTKPKNSVNATLITAAAITVIAVVAVIVLYVSGKRPKLPPQNKI